MKMFYFFFSSRRRHTRSDRDWSSDVCSSDLDRPAGRGGPADVGARHVEPDLRGQQADRGRDPGGRGENHRSGERRVGEEGRSWWAAYHLKKKKMNTERIHIKT